MGSTLRLHASEHFKTFIVLYEEYYTHTNFAIDKQPQHTFAGWFDDFGGVAAPLFCMNYFGD